MGMRGSGLHDPRLCGLLSTCHKDGALTKQRPLNTPSHSKSQASLSDFSCSHNVCDINMLN